MEPVPLPLALSDVNFVALPDGMDSTVAVTVALLGHPLRALELAALTRGAGAYGGFDLVLSAALSVAGEADADELIDRAVLSAATITDGFERTRVMFNIAVLMAARDPTNRAATARAVQIVSSTVIPDELPEWMSRVLNPDNALAQIAEALAEASPANPDVVAAATALAEGLEDTTARRLSLRAIALQVANADPTNRAAIDRALELDSDSFWRGEIAVLMARSDPSDPADIARAVELARTVKGGGAGGAQADIAECVAASRPDSDETLTRAQAVAAGISDSWHQAVAAARISDAIRDTRSEQAASLFDDALRLARAIDDEDERSAALADIAKRVARRDPTNLEMIQWASEIASAIPQNEDRRSTMVEIAKVLASADPTNPDYFERALDLLAQVADEARSEPESGSRAGFSTVAHAVGTQAEVVVRACSGLGNSDPVRAKALIDRAIGLVMREPDVEIRSSALADLAELVAPIEPLRASQLLGAAIELAKTLPPDRI